MNSMQTQTSAAAIVAGLAGFAAGHGWLGLSVTDWTTLMTAAAAVGAVVWPLVATRLQAAKTAVGNSGAIVVTNADSAKASPSPNVVTSSEVSSSAIAQAK